MSAHREAAEVLRDAHRAKAPFAPLPAALAPADLAAAYAIQDAGHALRGAPIAGWKIALTTKVMQEFVGIDHPLAGAIFAERVHETGASLDAGEYVNVGVESEIAVRLGADVAAAGAPYDRDSIAPFVSACMAATEVVDDRRCDYGALDPLLLAADNAFNAGCVLGPERPLREVPDLGAATGRMRINGEEVGAGQGADVLGHPLAALAWLANHLIERGRPLERGQVVLTGSVVPTKWPKPGDEMTTEIEGIGSATLRVR